MSARNHLNGLAAEDIAERHYLGQGARIAARRYRNPAGEVDLVVEEPAGTLVFVEVKARATHDAAAHAIQPAQWARIAAAAMGYLAEAGLSTNTDLRFDAVLIDKTGAAKVIPDAAQF